MYIYIPTYVHMCIYIYIYVYYKYHHLIYIIPMDRPPCSKHLQTNQGPGLCRINLHLLVVLGLGPNESRDKNHQRAPIHIYIYVYIFCPECRVLRYWCYGLIIVL